MTIPQALQIAVQHHQAGRLGEADALYDQILAAQPRHAEALRLRGVIAQQMGRHELAIEWILQAIALDPNYPTAHCVLGEAYHALGRVDEAIAAFRRALELKPSFAEAHNNLGNALREQDQLDEAICEFRRALQFKPDMPAAYNNLGAALAAQGELEEAVAAYGRALTFKLNFPEAWNNLGNALREQGQHDEALAAYGRALELRPDYPDAHNSLGTALLERGLLDEAVVAYGRALELKAGYPEAHSNLGSALTERGQLDEAIAACRRAIERKPGYAEAHLHLGNALKGQGLLDEAISAYRRALEVKPDHACARSNVIFALHFHPGHDARSIATEQQRWNLQFSEPAKQFLRPHANARDPDRRLRIGYVSADFRDHPVGRHALPLLERHDRERFEIFCYSGVIKRDSVTERFRALAGEWRNTTGVSDARMAEMIREDGVDILVDLAMHTAGNRLQVFARQPAPVQVSWLGYPGSTGLRGIGYRLTDAHMEPAGEESAWHPEEPVRLPDCWCCYQPVGESPKINALPALSARGVTFGSLNNFAKIHDGVLALWARMLEAVRGSRLVMLCPDGAARERVRAFFGARGIGAERVEFVGFVSRWEHLRLYQRIDLGLDPFPCNGMATTCDALWMGAPVLTLPGTMPVSRAGLSLLSCVGLGEMVASSEEDCVRIAAELAGDLPRLAELRAGMRARMQASPLMDAPRFARNVEAAYRDMWKRWCEDLSPLSDLSDLSE